MNFKEATDGLFARVSHDELAETLGVSVASIRQARLSKTAKAHREPPKGWETAIIQLANEQVGHYQTLARSLSEHAITNGHKK